MTNILEDLFACQLSYEECGHKSLIVEIGPELAQKLLALNFHQNRKLSKEYVNRLSADMKNGEWTLSNDAIVVSNELQVGNAQHRLNAVVQSKTKQKFLVLFGSARETFTKFDTGKKRTMEQRITIAGTEISLKECAVIRHAMNDYSSPGVGTVQFGYPRHDALVEKVFLKHKQFLTLTNAKKMPGSSFFHAAALKIYAHMMNAEGYGGFGNAWDNGFNHSHDPLTRAKLFIDLCNFGYSKDDIPCGPTEVAAIKLRNSVARKREEKRGQYWNEKNDLRVTVTAAWKFMHGDKVTNLVPFKTDPFGPFLQMPATNDVDFASCD